MDVFHEQLGSLLSEFDAVYWIIEGWRRVGGVDGGIGPLKKQKHSNQISADRCIPTGSVLEDSLKIIKQSRTRTLKNKIHCKTNTNVLYMISKHFEDSKHSAMCRAICLFGDEVGSTPARKLRHQSIWPPPVVLKDFLYRLKNIMLV